MIVSALVKRYEETRDVPPGWQRREASYALVIDGEGRLLGVQSLETMEGKRRVKRSFTLPLEPPGRTSGIDPAFLCDNGTYLLGLDPKRGKRKFDTSRTYHAQIFDGIDTPEAKAVMAYFDAGIPENIAEFIEPDTAAKATLVFMFNGRFIDYDCAGIRGAWDAWYSKDAGEGDAIRCLVSGLRDSPEAIHGSVKLRGGQMSGSRLISANAESFTSYGKTAKDRAADIGKYAAFAYVTALEALLGSERNRKFIGGDTVVFWAEKGGEAEEALFGNMFDPPKEGVDKELYDVLNNIVKGKYAMEYNPDIPFYLLCLSPNAARISVRFFYQGTYGELIRNIRAHYARLEIVPDNRTPFPFLPPWLILAETTVKGSASDAAPLLGGQLLRCILTGADYPLTLYNAMISRIRAGADITRTKAAVIKAALLKKNGRTESEVLTVALNEQTTYKPYVLGRLFSVLERLQDNANNSTNIRSRYFSGACANPASVFPTLLSLSMHHADKLSEGNFIFFEKLKGELIGHLDSDDPFPATLSLDDQGCFIVGYYHQTQFFFTKRNQEEDKADE